MPSGVHELFVGSFESEVEKGLKTLADKLRQTDRKTADEILRIRKSGSPTLVLKEPELQANGQQAEKEPVIVRHSPDASFKHPKAGAQAPGLVLEVSYSQPREKKLSKLAESYIIVGTESDVSLESPSHTLPPDKGTAMPTRQRSYRFGEQPWRSMAAKTWVSVASTDRPFSFATVQDVHATASCD